jgi:uroporphyrinogen decarboxylase
MINEHEYITGGTMNSRDRLVTALNHKEPDRIPVDLGATFTSGIHVSTYNRLRDYLGLPPRQKDQFLCLDEQIVFVDEDIKEKLTIDTEPVLPGNASNWSLSIEERIIRFTRMNGIWVSRNPGMAVFITMWLNIH